MNVKWLVQEWLLMHPARVPFDGPSASLTDAF